MNILWVSWANLDTTKRICETVLTSDVNVKFCEITDFIIEANHQGSTFKLGGENVIEKFDILVLRAFYPYISEALSLAQIFSSSGKPVVDACLVEGNYVISKMHNYSVLANNKIPVPHTRQLFTLKSMNDFAAQLGFPVILKGVHGGQGTHVYLANDPQELSACAEHYPAGGLLVQEFIPGAVDFRVMVVGGKALPAALQRTASVDDFRTNAPAGGSSKAVELNTLEGFKPLAEQAAKILERACAGVDIRLREGIPVILEVNRLPNFVPFEQKTGIDVACAFVKWVSTLAGEREIN